MLIGATGSFASEPQRARLLPVEPGDPRGGVHWIGGSGAVACVRPWGVRALDAAVRVASDPVSGSWLALSGRWLADLAAGRPGRPRGEATQLLERLATRGLAVLGEVEGELSLAWFDGASRRLHLVRDRFGAEPLHYGLGRGGALFGSRVRDLVTTRLLADGLCPQGLAEYLAFGAVWSDATLDAQIRRVPPAHAIVMDDRGHVLARERWWRLGSTPARGATGPGDADALREALTSAVSRRLDGDAPAVVLRGDPASGAMAAIAARRLEGPLRSFAFRGEGDGGAPATASAQALAVSLGMRHASLSFEEAEAEEFERAAADWDVPFSDGGCELDGLLLARAGGGDPLLLADGAEILLANDPAHAAQRADARIAHLPLPKPLERVLRRVGSRAAPPAGAPRELGASRWRCLRSADEILALVTSETALELATANPWKAVHDAREGFEGPDDGLAADLYADYRLVSARALDRLAWLRSFGIDARSPYLDHELVELGASLPIESRLPGSPASLVHAAIRRELPAAVAGIGSAAVRPTPARAWIASEGALGALGTRLISSDSLRARGLLRPEAVQRIVSEHAGRRCDHARALWSLAVLELWLRARDSVRGGGGTRWT